MHTESAKALCHYEHDFYAGMPVLTRNAFGKGAAYYVATRSDAGFYQTLIGDICREAGIEPIIEKTGNVEVTMRRNANGTFLFFLNHDEDTHDICLHHAYRNILTDVSYKEGDMMTLAGRDVAILMEIPQ